MLKKKAARFGAYSTTARKADNREFMDADSKVTVMHPGPDRDYRTPKPLPETDEQVLARLEREVVDNFLRHSRSAVAVRIELLREAIGQRKAA